MNKRLTVLILLIFCLLVAGLYFAVRGWVAHQALQAIESTTGAKAQFEGMSLDLWAGRLELRNLNLTPRDASAPWRRLDAEIVTGKICWGDWSAGEIPMEATLRNTTLQLREPSPLELLKAPLRIPSLPAPAWQNAAGTAMQAGQDESGKFRITLTMLDAKNISVVANSPGLLEVSGSSDALGASGSQALLTLASSLDCTARRGLQGWQGTLSAATLGPKAFPLRQVKAEFSTEPGGTRVAQFRCQLDPGEPIQKVPASGEPSNVTATGEGPQNELSGSGWYSTEGILALQLQAVAVPVTAIAPRWFGMTGGQLSGQFQYQGDPLRWQENSIVEGRFTLQNGALKLPDMTALLAQFATQKLPDALAPLLAWAKPKPASPAASIAATEPAALLHLDLVSGQFKRTPSEWELSEIALKKTGFIALSGNLHCRENPQKNKGSGATATQPENGAANTDTPQSLDESLLKADLKIGIAKAFLHSLGLAPAENNSGEETASALQKNASAERLDANFYWTTLSLETTPDQLQKQLLAMLLTALIPAPASVSSDPSQPASSQNPASGQPATLRQKATDAAKSMFDILTR